MSIRAYPFSSSSSLSYLQGLTEGDGNECRTTISIESEDPEDRPPPYREQVPVPEPASPSSDRATLGRDVQTTILRAVRTSDIEGGDVEGGDVEGSDVETASRRATLASDDWGESSDVEAASHMATLWVEGESDED